jgi:hypothetical protein
MEEDRICITEKLVVNPNTYFLVGKPKLDFILILA